MKCSRCGQDQPEDLFIPSDRYRCRPCRREAQRARRKDPAKRAADVRAGKRWRDRNPDRCRGYNLYRYGITLEDYRARYLAQGGKCAVCQKQCPEIPTRRMDGLVVDHCHITGRVRGLLCNSCNRGIGYLGDTAEQVLKAHKYLEEQP